MENNWYYLDPELPEASRRVGPLTRIQVEELALQGKITKDHLLWYPGLVGWQAWKEISPDFPGNSPEHRCSACGLTFLENVVTYQNSRWTCKSCLAPVNQAPSAPNQANNSTPFPSDQYASFGIRLAAFLVDLMILGSVNAILVMVYMFLFQIPADVLRESMAINIPGLFLEGAYQIFFLSQYGGTPGKMLMGLRVVTAEGKPLSVMHAIGRYFSFWLSAASLGIGFFIILFDPQRRALHDYVAKTRVLLYRAPIR
jgi:uncharacterized RDD family membrane protein YckC